jgi:hypothetical protein
MEEDTSIQMKSPRREYRKLQSRKRSRKNVRQCSPSITAYRKIDAEKMKDELTRIVENSGVSEGVKMTLTEYINDTFSRYSPVDANDERSYITDALYDARYKMEGITGYRIVSPNYESLKYGRISAAQLRMKIVIEYEQDFIYFTYEPLSGLLDGRCRTGMQYLTPEEIYFRDGLEVMKAESTTGQEATVEYQPETYLDVNSYRQIIDPITSSYMEDDSMEWEDI